MNSKSGFSLIEVMIAVGIVSTLTLGFASMMNSQSRMSKVIAQKMEIVTLKQTLISMTNNPAICRCQLDRNMNTASAVALSINGSQSGPQTLNLDSVRSSCDLASDATLIAKVNDILQGSQTGQKVSTIKVENILPIAGSPYMYSGHLTVSIDPSSQIQSLRAVDVPLMIGVDPTSSVNSMRIQSCSGVSYDGGSAPIICRKLGNIFASGGSSSAAPGVGTKTTTFAAGDCGGALPDANYIGAFAKMYVCGISSQWTVMQPSDGPPGFSMYTLGDCTPPYPRADVQVIFIHK